MFNSLDYAVKQQASDAANGQAMDSHEVDGLVGYLIQGAFTSRSVASGERLLDWLHSAPDAEAMGQNGLRYPLTEEHYCRYIARIQLVCKSQSCMVSKPTDIYQAHADVRPSQCNGAGAERPAQDGRDNRGVYARVQHPAAVVRA